MVDKNIALKFSYNTLTKKFEVITSEYADYYNEETKEKTELLS